MRGVKKITPKIPSYRISEIKKAHSTDKDFEFFRFEKFAENIDHLKSPHRHNHFAIFFITGGTGSHLIDFKEYRLSAKRIFLIAPGQVHAWQSLKDLTGFVLLFTREFYTLTLQYRELRSYLFDNMVYQTPMLQLNNQSYAQLQNIFAYIETEYTQQGRYSQNIIRSYINIVLFEISRGYEESLPMEVDHHRADALVREFLALVNRNFRDEKGVSNYAAQMHISPSYLNSICKKYKGKAAGEIIRDRVILEAKRLLAHSELTAAEIAYDLHFEDNSYFGRFFKKYTRKSPAQFRLQVKKDVTKRI